MPVGAILFSRMTFAGLALNFAGDSADGRHADRRHGASCRRRLSRAGWRWRAAWSRTSAPPGSSGRRILSGLRRSLTFRVAAAELAVRRDLLRGARCRLVAARARACR